MSGNEGDHKDLSHQPLDEFEQALRASATGRSIPKSIRIHTVPKRRCANLPTCERAAGHEFVCLHCGIDAAQIIRRHRWAWPAALTAMTSAAAILLVMLIANRSARVADRETKSVANAPTVAVQIKPLEPQNRIETDREPDIAFRRFALQDRDRRRILSAGDTELRDDLLASHMGFDRGNPVSFADTANADGHQTNGEMLRHLLREYGVAAGPTE